MKFFTLLSFLAVVLFSLRSNAQVYTQGDLTVMQMPTTTHDSTICGTVGQMMYQITVQNSFVGDDIVIKDQDWGTVLFQTTNTSGQNPWVIVQPLDVAFIVIPDWQIVGGYANFWGPTTKVISGTDTVHNIINSYSAFVPDPCEYSTISGSAYVDYNANCINDAGDVPLNNLWLSVFQVYGGGGIATSSDGVATVSDGTFNKIVQQSWTTTTTVSLPPYLQFIFPPSPCAATSYTFTTLPQTNLDFPLQCSNNMDVQCYVGTPPAARPAVPFAISPFVNNTGCDPASGVLTLILDPGVTYDATLSSYPADVVNGDTLTWYYNNLSNLSNGMYWNSFISSVYLVPDSSLNVGDTLCFHVYANIPATDVDASNNDYSVCIPVVNSYDPNMKQVTPAGTGPQGLIPQSVDELTYTIHFQNTGTAPAFNVSVVDTLPSMLDASTLKIIGASHAMTPEWLSNNVVRFNFYNINLPDSFSNEPLSHGFVTFKIKFNTLPIGTEIQNTGYIYFDFNTAVVTNTALNTVSELNAIANVGANALVDVFPNPTDGVVYISNASASGDGYDVQIEDCVGKIISTLHAQRSLQTVDVSGIPNGIYLVRVIDRKTGSNVVKKLVKQ